MANHNTDVSSNVVGKVAKLCRAVRMTRELQNENRLTEKRQFLRYVEGHEYPLQGRSQVVVTSNMYCAQNLIR